MSITRPRRRSGSFYYRKASGKPESPTTTPSKRPWLRVDRQQPEGIDDEQFAQRFTPRRRVGGLSEMNKQRVRRLVAEGRMTPAGMAVIGDALDLEPFVLSPDVERALHGDPETWRNFDAFPESYRRLRIAFVESARRRPAEFDKRLAHFVKMTKQNRRFGYVKEFK